MGSKVLFHQSVCYNTCCNIHASKHGRLTLLSCLVFKKSIYEQFDQENNMPCTNLLHCPNLELGSYLQIHLLTDDVYIKPDHIIQIQLFNSSLIYVKVLLQQQISIFLLPYSKCFHTKAFFNQILVTFLLTESVCNSKVLPTMKSVNLTVLILQCTSFN